MYLEYSLLYLSLCTQCALLRTLRTITNESGSSTFWAVSRPQLPEHRRHKWYAKPIYFNKRVVFDNTNKPPGSKIYALALKIWKNTPKIKTIPFILCFNKCPRGLLRRRGTCVLHSLHLIACSLNAKFWPYQKIEEKYHVHCNLYCSVYRPWIICLRFLQKSRKKIMIKLGWR